MDFPLLRFEKGSPLSHEEMDRNWLRSAVQVGHWRNDFFYAVNDLTAFNGQIYKSLAPNLNKTPAINPSDWVVWVNPHNHTFADLIAATVDDHTMAADSAVLLPTQRSVKQYVLSQISGVSYTDNQAKDAIGAALESTNSVEFTYNAGPRTINAGVRLDGGSLTITAMGVKIADLGISTSMIQLAAIDSTLIADGAVTESKLDVLNTPSSEWALLWDSTSSKMRWTDLSPLLYSDAQAVDAVASVLAAGPGISIDLSDPQSGITISLGATTAPANYFLKLSDDTTPLETSASPLDTFHVPFDMQVSSLSASLTNPSTTGPVTLTISRNGTPILTSPIVIDEAGFTSLTAAVPPEATAGELDWVAGDKIEIFLTTAGTGATGLKLSIGYASTVVIDGSSADQTAIQFKDEGSDLGAAGNVETIDFVGSGVTADRTGSKLTVTVPGGAVWEAATAADVNPAVGKTYYVMLTGGILREITLPASVPVNFTVRVVAVGGQVRVLSNSNTITDVGAGNDLLLSAGEMVELVATSTGVLEITDFCSLP